jgi:hypothetical protein
MFCYIVKYNIRLGNGTGGKPYGGMTDELSDDEDRKQIGRGGGGAGMDDEYDDVDVEMDPRQGGVRQRQQPSQQTPYDDDENF